VRRACFFRLGYFPQEEHLRKNARALCEAGYQVDVVCLREPGQPGVERYWGGFVFRLPMAHRRTGLLRHLWEHLAFCLLLAVLVPALWAWRRHSVLEFYGPPDYAVFAALLPRLLGARLVLYIFDLLPETLARGLGLGEDSLAVRLAGWAERASTALAQAVVVEGPHERDVVVARGTPAEKVVWVPNVPDEDVFRPSAGVSPPEDGFVVMTHGTLLARYGIDEVVRAAALLRGRIPRLRAWIVGEGEHRPVAQALAASLGLDGVVTFVGWVPYASLAALVARADVGVVPLRFNSLPNKLFEYALSGRAVVAADLPSIRRLFGDALLYFPPGDAGALAEAISRLYADPDLRRRLGEAAREVAQRHAWSRVRHLYVALHESGPRGIPLPESDA